MLGIQLPPLYLERSLETLSRLNYFTPFFPPPPAVPLPFVILVVSPPSSEDRSLTPSGQSVLHSLHLEDEIQTQIVRIIPLHSPNNTDGMVTKHYLLICKVVQLICTFIHQPFGILNEKYCIFKYFLT